MNFDFGILELLFLLAVAFLTFRKISKASNEITNITNNEPQVEVVVGKSEVHNNQIFLWDKNTNVFLCQGSTIENAIKNFLKNNPNKRIVFEVNE
jgi:hypothetical protein